MTKTTPINIQLFPDKVSFETTGFIGVANAKPIRSLQIRPGVDMTIKFTFNELMQR